ncbi:MAG: ribonuclease P protein component [Desulfuromonadales bacterium]|nr:ribonuclease P protein component [Desulfuromonadales bacterium]
MDARPDQGFPPSCRLRTSREYTKVWRQGRRCHTAHLTVIAGSAPAEARLGISVGRKVGNAVCRNRLKRWIREYFRIHRAEIHAGTDISVIVKPGAAQLDHATIDRQFEEALRRLLVNGNA